MNTHDSKSGLRIKVENILKNRKPSAQIEIDVYQIIKELNLHQIELEIQNENLIKSQVELEESHQQYYNLYNLAPIPYFTLNTDGLIIDANKAAVNLIGINKNSLLYQRFSQHISTEHQMLFSQFRQSVNKENIAHKCEITILPWSGPPLDALLQCISVQTSATGGKKFLICVTDMTSRNAKEKSIHLQQAKMSSIDKANSINAHLLSVTMDQNNSLAILGNYINGCMRRLESHIYNKDELQEAFKKASLQAKDMANGISQLHNSISLSTLRYETININQAINDALSLLSYELDDFPVAIHYSPSDYLPLVNVDKLHIQHVILTIARNAIAGMKEANIDQPRILVEARKLNNAEIIVSLLDNGPGISQPQQQMLLNADFTTKTAAFGLSLQTSRDILAKHGGELSTHLNPCGGANLHFTLPCAQV